MLRVSAPAEGALPAIGAGAPPPDAGRVDRFARAMEGAVQRVDAGPMSTRAAMQAPGPTNVTSGGVVERVTASMEARFEELRRDAFEFGTDLDVSQPSSVLVVYERQVRMTLAMMQYHALLQSADNVKGAVKQLTQMQS